MTEANLEPTFAVPRPRKFGQAGAPPAPVPSLGPLAAFSGSFVGGGLNTIFRPNLGSPTPVPSPAEGNPDNILELNLTHETLTFLPSLGAVPNRGEVQQDAFLNGVPYQQVISDVTNPAAPFGIHFEPGLWMTVPATTNPAEGPTLARMASIPHGTTINAQGTSLSVAGPPVIDPVSITPFTPAGVQIRFPSQTAALGDTFRVPQDLDPFIISGTITQDILDDPNTVLRNAIKGQTISETVVIPVSTDPDAPLFGGGTDNIAFLLGSLTATAPNSQATQMSATFWIETVKYIITVPAYTPGQPPLLIPGEGGQFAPTFLVQPSGELSEPTVATVSATQIQYSQKVILNFNGLLWPHVSVATLVPAAPVPVTI